MDPVSFLQTQDYSSLIIKEPGWLISNANQSSSQQSLKLIQSIHDSMVKSSSKFKSKDEKLVITNMSEEQIWEQLNLHLKVLDKSFTKYISSLEQNQEQSIKPSESFNYPINKKGREDIVDEDEDDENEESDENEIELESEFEDDSEEEQIKAKKTKNSNIKKKQAEQDSEESNKDDKQEENQRADKFFKEQENGEEYEEKLDFAEMEAFLDKQDEEDIERDSEAEDELGSDYEVDDGDSQLGEGDDGFKFKGRDDYDDMNQEEEGEEDEEKAGDQDDEKMREQDYDVEDQIFDLEREHQLTEQPVEEKIHNEDEIERLEKKLIGDKEWILKGEISSKARPVNSLVQQDIDFRKNIKATQEVDDSYNKNLEALIKQRILDEAFDDRQRINFEQAYRETFNSMAEISKEKSKQGLGELYELDFKNSLGLPQNNKEDKLKLEIHNLFREVCYKLDALSNLSFTPKPVLQQAQITTNVPSLKHEERIPISISQADTQRPEEVFNKKKEVVFTSKDEMTHEEKQTERRQKKSAARQRNKEKEKKKLIKNLEYQGQTKYEYNQVQKAQQNGKKLLEGKRQKSVEFTKSSEFFKNMQNNVNNQDQKQNAAIGKKKAIKKVEK